MPTYTQANRILSITTSLAPDTLLLEKLSGTEAISQLFRFKLDLLSQKPIAFDQVLGKPATVTLTLPNGTGRYFTGIIRRLRQGEWLVGPTGAQTFLRYQAELVPALWLLTRRVQSRIFQQLSVPDILKKILKDDWQLDVAFKLTGTYEPRNYCVQYGESDFAFVSRLMEEEGICYFFQHDQKGNTLVLADSSTTLPDLPGPAAIIHDTVRSGWKAEPRIHAWSKSQEVRASKHTICDWSFQLPKNDFTASASAGGSVGMGTVMHNLTQPHLVNGKEMLENYEYPAAFGHRFDGIDKGGAEQAQELQKLFACPDRVAKLRHEREAVRGMRGQGAGDAGNFVPGGKFTLARHFDANGSYLLTRVKHRASLEGAYTSTEKLPEVYENEFECIPAALPYRPRCSTPRPRIEGLQTATVVGPKGQEVFLDKYGRVKVQFRWDREGKMNEASSCWVRVAQVWAGKSWGAFFWPRVGHEVVVAFEEGNPDRPLIVGSLYNDANLPPLHPPTTAYYNGIKSCILGQDPAQHFNALVFHDLTGEEYVQIHSENATMDNSKVNGFKYVPRGQMTFHGSF